MKLCISFVLSIFCAIASAQDEAQVDSLGIESISIKESITQYEWKKYEFVDTCTSRYAVVHDWNGRCGIYDLELKRNLTELEYRTLFFSRMMDLEDGSQAALFFGYKGHSEGIVSVASSGDVAAVMMLDEDQTYSLDSCRTIDKEVTELSRELLEEDMKEHDGLYGQVLVMETQTGNIKAWVALEDEFRNGDVTDAPLLKHQLCSDPQKLLFSTISLVESNTALTDSIDTGCGVDSIGGQLIKDHNWARGGFGKITYLDGFKYHSNVAMAKALERNHMMHEWWNVSDCPREMDALSVATMYNMVALDGRKVIVPSVNTDSIQVLSSEGFPENDFCVTHMMRECLKATLQDGGIGSLWTTNDVDVSGDYIAHRNCRPTLYDDNLKDLDQYYSEEGLTTYNQVIFIGYFPSDEPRYTICVSMDCGENTISGKYISNTVNKLVEYLNKH